MAKDHNIGHELNEYFLVCTVYFWYYDIRNSSWLLFILENCPLSAILIIIELFPYSFVWIEIALSKTKWKQTQNEQKYLRFSYFNLYREIMNVEYKPTTDFFFNAYGNPMGCILFLPFCKWENQSKVIMYPRLHKKWQVCQTQKHIVFTVLCCWILEEDSYSRISHIGSYDSSRDIIQFLGFSCLSYTFSISFLESP
jgi:hypothetical protein